MSDLYAGKVISPDEYYRVHVGPLHSNGAESTTDTFSKLADAQRFFTHTINDLIGAGGREIILQARDGQWSRTIGSAEVY